MYIYTYIYGRSHIRKRGMTSQTVLNSNIDAILEFLTRIEATFLNVPATACQQYYKACPQSQIVETYVRCYEDKLHFCDIM